MSEASARARDAATGSNTAATGSDTAATQPVTPATGRDVAETYYDSNDADVFYSHIWGGEDIHIGLYDGGVGSISEASHRTLDRMATELGTIGAGAKVIDLGAGYGGAARYLARRFGCHVTCLNLSEVQNERNRKLTEEAGLSDKVTVIHGTFEDIPADDGAFDLVWAQDAILHSADRRRVLQEVARVTRPGGSFLFTDPMQADDCPDGVLTPVLARIHLPSLGSVGFYRREMSLLGFREVAVIDLTKELGNHYSAVRDQLLVRKDELARKISSAYIDRMLEGLNHWIEAQGAGHLSWGILHFRKP